MTCPTCPACPAAAAEAEVVSSARAKSAPRRPKPRPRSHALSPALSPALRHGRPLKNISPNPTPTPNAVLGRPLKNIIECSSDAKDVSCRLGKKRYEALGQKGATLWMTDLTLTLPDRKA